MPGSKTRPSLRALEVFDAVARHSSLSRAAEELGVTQSAVSHQMRYLTEHVGEKLYQMVGRRAVLTPAGKTLADRMRSIFQSLDRSIAEVVGADRSIVRLALCSSFAPGWLVPRLPDFHASHPDIRLQLQMYAADPDLTDKVADAFVTTLPTEAGFWSLKLMSERLIPVLAADREPGEVPLVTTTLAPPEIGDDWRDFCRGAGLSLQDLSNGDWLQVSHYVTALDIARRGFGMSLVPDFLAEAAISSGTLKVVSTGALATGEDYYLCIKSARRDEASLAALAEWFAAQVDNDSPRAMHEKHS